MNAKVSKASVSMRKKVYGVGINDADYNVTTKVDGKRVTCAFYLKWSDMIKRCYCKSFQSKNRSYLGCKVDEQWLTFSTFKSWMERQDWFGMELDKDLLSDGMKIYSKETCCFLPKSINSLLTFKKYGRDGFSVGVAFSTLENKFKASCRVDGKRFFLGTFERESDAHASYLAFKRKVIADKSLDFDDPIRSALINYSIDLCYD